MTERDQDRPRSIVGQTSDDWLSMQQGSDVCFRCKRRMTPAEIASCERRGECQGGES